MSGSEDAFQSLIQEYIAESLPLAEQAADTFVSLERRWQDGDPAEEAFAPLHGVLHTVKGNSAMMGLTPIQSLAHSLEDLCGLLRQSRALRPAAAGLLVEGGGLLVNLIESSGAGAVRPQATEAYLARVKAFSDQSSTTGLTAFDEGSSSDAQTWEERRLPGRRATDRAEAVVDTVRIQSRQLDTLLEIFGEAVIAQSSLSEVQRRLVAEVGASAGLTDLDHAVVMMEKTFKRLEGALMEARLLPISTVFSRFGRLVRDLAHAEGKRVRLQILGGETRLDKTIIDRIGEPLVHLITNAVIHGIEPAEERERQGKPPEATLRLIASHRSNRVSVEVADDGRGLDPEKILQKARALGVHMPPSPSADDVYALAFLPGLSTADQVSAVAGRGVGLDVVSHAIHALGGAVQLSSEPGRGTVFALSLPVSVAVARSLIVEVDHERYAVPLSDVAETLRATAEAIHEVDGRAMTLWRGRLIPVSDAGSLLGTASTRRSRAYCVVVHSASRRRGLLVDRLRGHQDVVVKPLDRTLGRITVVSGAGILGDGRVACILDAARIIEQGLYDMSAVAPAMA